MNRQWLILLAVTLLLFVGTISPWKRPDTPQRPFRWPHSQEIVPGVFPDPRLEQKASHRDSIYRAGKARFENLRAGS